MHTSFFESQIAFLRHVIATCSDELTPIHHTLLDSYLSLSQAVQSFTLDKTQLLQAFDSQTHVLNSDNLVQRLAQLNTAFMNGQGKQVFRFAYTESAVCLHIDQEAFFQFGQSQNNTQLDAFKSGTTNNLRQVMFSYCWGGREAILKRKREFAALLQERLKTPPAQYKNEQKINLFIDVTGFEVGENQQQQQTQACEQSAVAVVPYCDGYLYSNPCQDEIGHFLSKEGDNHCGKKAIIAPFSTQIQHADVRYLKNLAAVPTKYATVLALLESGTETEIQAYIEQLVHVIYKHFQK